MEFHLLGPLRVTDGDRDVTPTAPKLREVLALLVLRCNQIVQTEVLIDELWGVNPPVTALSTLQTYIYKLRKLLWSPRDPDDAPLKTKSAGYILEISARDADFYRFFELLKKGSESLERADPEAAGQELRQALALWSGPQLADVGKGQLLSAHALRLGEGRLTALELRIDADLQLGRHRELVSELRELTSEHPMHEGFRAKLMIALHRSGRRCEALEAYQGLRHVLVDELGLEPSAALRRLHQEILAADADDDLGPADVPVALPRTSIVARQDDDLPRSSPLPDAPVPAQLPAGIADFVGRADTIAEVTRLLAERDRPQATPIVVLTGMPGCGKTTLAVRIAHQVADGFPGGQLYVTLGASTGRPRDPYYVLGELLHLLRFRPDDVPDSLHSRSIALRTWAAAKGALIVLDDADSVSQVGPLLPGSADCAVLVTSRFTLSGLAGAQVVEVAALDREEALRLFANVVGDQRVERERSAAEEIVAQCGRLPLAVRSAGARLAAARAWPISRLAEMLADEQNRLDVLTFADVDVRARIDRSYRRLSDCGKSALRLLSLLPKANFSAGQLSELMGRDRDTAESLLSELASCHLVEIVTPSAGAAYALPELIRLYARGRLEEILDDASSRRVRSSAVHSVSGGRAPVL